MAKDEIELTEKDFEEAEERERRQRMEAVREKFGQRGYQYMPKQPRAPEVYATFGGRLKQRAQVMVKQGFAYARVKGAEAAATKAEEARIYKTAFRRQRLIGVARRARREAQAPSGGLGFGGSDESILGFSLGGPARRQPMRQPVRYRAAPRRHKGRFVRRARPLPAERKKPFLDLEGII